MSKQALSLLLKEFVKKEDADKSIVGTSKTYRKEFLDKKKQIFEIGTLAHIAEELKAEIRIAEPNLLVDGLVTQDDINAAALALRNAFLARVKPENVLDKDGGVVVYNTYDPMAKNLSAANKVAFELLEKAVTARNGSTGKLSSALTSPDHVRTNAEIRFSQVFYNKLSDPVKSLRYLRDFGKLSEESYTTFLTQYNEITSYYTNGTKVFDLSVGAELKLRSRKGNEAAGNELTKALTEEIRSAVNNAVINKNWADQEGSDSYKAALFKELNNIVVKGGGTGKIQAIDKSKNTAKQSTRTAIKVVQYKPAKVKKIEAKQPLINLQSIVSYINGRLPEAVRKNMGSGSLVNRTGTFSESAKLISAQMTPQGYPSLGYTYQRSPYDVFDPVLGKKPWNTPGRDPKKIIEKSVRDIAKEMAIGRFYVRRA